MVGDFNSLPTEQRIEAVMDGFNLTLDPTGLAPDQADKAREALKAALDALGEPQSS